MKTKKNTDIFKMTKEESEKFLGEATRKAIAETHAMGRPSTHGDNKGVYRLYPDGHKEYIKLYEKNRNEQKEVVTVTNER